MLFLLSFKTENEKEKFEYIYQKYKKLMLYKAYDILKDYQLAEDAASEAFLRIYRNLYKITDPDSPQTISFVVTIVKNTALTILAKEKKLETEMYDEEQVDQTDLECEVLAELAAEHLQLIIDQLSEDLKSVFLLRYAHDFSNKEISKMQQISEQHVAVKLFRAKKKLSQLLIREGYANEIK